MLFYEFLTKGQKLTCLPLVLGIILCGNFAKAQDKDSLDTFSQLKKLSIEQLMEVEIEVISVSKRPEKLLEAASAVQVITKDDIRNSGATNLPEALRLVPNLQVAQVNASQWAISARGFNNVLANKLLVMIDGRVVYTPMYAGVFWDVQNVMLEDVERIEVVSGPGGTLWGANAVNGVINIITKNSKDTKGTLAQVSAGTSLLSQTNLRFGGQITDRLSYRVFGSAFKRGSTVLNDTSKAQLKENTNTHDAWTMGMGGFRMDWESTKKDLLTVQGNLYDGRPDPDGAKPVVANGGNFLGRWNHRVSERSDFQLQAYYDHTWRDFRNGFAEKLKTYDLDGQVRVQVRKRHEVLTGFGLRLMDHQTNNLALFGFFPSSKTLHLYSAFVQDKITLIENRLSLTLGSKFEHNSYTGFQYQPSGRLAWTVAKRQMLWAAVSRAVRTPARIDREFSIYLTPELPIITGSNSFKSEELLAYELGWRSQLLEKLTISVSSFYNVYDNLRSAEPGPPPFGIPIAFRNGVKGHTYGVELAVNYQATKWWQLRGGFTFLKKELSVKPGSVDANNATAESNDPKHQFLIQSALKLPGRIELGTVFRYVGALLTPPHSFKPVPAYAGLDIRVAWMLNKIIEFSVVGQNLASAQHAEFIPTSPSPRNIQRSVYGKVICHF